MHRTTSWIWKWLRLSAAVGMAIVCYLFLRAHQELAMQPSRCWQIGALAFVTSLIASLIYFRMLAER